MCQHLVADAFSVAGVTQLRLFRPRSFETDIPSTRTRFFMKKDLFSSAAIQKSLSNLYLQYAYQRLHLQIVHHINNCSLLNAFLASFGSLLS
jgi:hypothetical protein